MESEFRAGTIRKLTPKTQQPMQTRKELKCSDCGAESLHVFVPIELLLTAVIADHSGKSSGMKPHERSKSPATEYD